MIEYSNASGDRLPVPVNHSLIDDVTYVRAPSLVSSSFLLRLLLLLGHWNASTVSSYDDI